MRIVKTTFNLFSQSFFRIWEVFKGGEERTFRQVISDGVKDMKQSFLDLLTKLKDLKHTNLDLGKFHYKNGNLSDAKIRLHITRLFFSNTPPEVYYFLGRVYFEQGKLPSAIKYLDKYLAADDGNFRSEAEYTKLIIEDKGNAIKYIPDTIIERQFDLVAPLFNEIYIIDNHSCVQNYILQEIKKTLSDIAKPFGNKLLDLGCGTGYLGAKLKESKAVSHVVGVDLSDKMLRIAQNLTSDDLTVYDETIKSNIVSYVDKIPNNYDIIMASQVFNHIHDWSQIMTKCVDKLNSGGVFIFTFKVLGNEKGTFFDRYAEEFLHSGDEIMTRVKKLTNCSILVTRPLTFELENDTGLIILKKK